MAFFATHLYYIKQNVALIPLKHSNKINNSNNSSNNNRDMPYVFIAMGRHGMLLHFLLKSSIMYFSLFNLQVFLPL